MGKKMITSRKSHQLKGRRPNSDAVVSVVVCGSQPHSTSWSIRLASASCMYAPPEAASIRVDWAIQLAGGTAKPDSRFRRSRRRDRSADGVASFDFRDGIRSMDRVAEHIRVA